MMTQLHDEDSHVSDHKTTSVPPELGGSGITTHIEDRQNLDNGGTEVQVHLKTIIVVAAICFTYAAQLMAVAGSGFLAQPITQLFGAPSKAVWPNSVVGILTCALSPSFSQAADLWGRKWLLVTSQGLGFIGSIIVSRSQTVGTVIAGFTALGASCGSQPLLHAVVSEILPRRYRPIAQSSINMAAGLGGFLSLAMGGALLRTGHLENYRIFWYVVAGLFIACGFGCGLCYNPPPRELQSLPLSEKTQRIDWIGSFLFIAGLTLFCVALSWSRNPYGWTSAHILAPFITGTFMALCFVVYEWLFKADGLLHHGLFANRTFAFALWCVFTEGLAFFTCNRYFAYQSTVFTHVSFLTAGVQFGVVFIATSIFAMLGGIYSTRRRAIRSPTVVGFVLMLLFNILMAVLTPRSPKSVFWGYPVLAGAGLGIVLPAIMVSAQLSTPPELISITSGLVIAIRSLGGTIGLAVNNAIFNYALATNVGPKVTSATLTLGLPQSSLPQLIAAVMASNQTALQDIPGMTTAIAIAAQDALAVAYAIAFRNTWIAACCFCAAAIIGSFFLSDMPSEFNAHIDAPVEIELAEIQEAKERAQRADA